MQARGPLMIEHRLIEKMLNTIGRVLVRVEKTQSIDPYFVDTAVDFIRVYADRTHHGKEEDILFRYLRAKNMSGEDRKLMEDLIEQHIFSRATTKKLVEANTRYRNKDTKALGEVTSCLRTLVDFYPGHINKEDQVFFPASRAYLSDQEDQKMLEEFYEFDRKMIHDKYKAVVSELTTQFP
ncbi:MAG TPA: hemerythrin domain-containing protein [Syntrophorhabdaceae bacterium]|nr:hemerythrin domain-containing protein [Syntrophorhabdaceae bacterium]